MLPRHVPLPNPVNAASLRHNNLHSTVITLTDTGVRGCWKNDRKKNGSKSQGPEREGGGRLLTPREGGRGLFFSFFVYFLVHPNLFWKMRICILEYHIAVAVLQASISFEDKRKERKREARLQAD